jgi:hypothetical protein
MLVSKGADLKIIVDDQQSNLVHTLAMFGMTPEERSAAFAKGKAAMESFGYKVPAWYSSLPAERNGTSDEMLKILITGGADINAKTTNNDYTPLTLSIELSGKLYVAKALVNQGADVNLMTKNNNDAVSMAAERGDLELIKLLVARGANVENETWAVDKASGQIAKGFTPLTKAVIANCTECARFLIQAGSKPKEGVSGYHISKKTGCPYHLKNKTAIYYAIELGNLEMIKTLTESFDYWNKYNMEMKQPDNTQSFDAGSVTIEITSCWKIKGVYSPSRYAKELGEKEIESFLKGQGL